MEEVFIQLSLILGFVFIISLFMRLLRQPLIIGYLISGILVGPVFLNLIQNNSSIQIFSQIGVAFLLFVVGLNLSPKIIKEVGKISLITGIGQIIFTTIVGYFIGLAVGFNSITSFYVSFALTFSSTIIIMKLLSDKEALETLYGKISIGFLLVQDVVAIIILICISSFSTLPTGNVIFSLMLKILAIIVLSAISYAVLPKIISFFAKSQEFLFLFAISWGLGFSALFFYLNFSLEAGALVAGVLLSASQYSLEISSKLRPLRDFFMISFFLVLGSQLIFSDINSIIFPIIIFSVFVLIGNPLIVMILMGYFGYSKRTGFMAGLTVAQISEFSLILISIGVRNGTIPKEIMSFTTLVGLITIAGSTYLIMFSDKIYRAISKYLSIFERKNVKENNFEALEYEYVLFGENRIGFSIMKSFIKSKKKYLIVEYNPLRVKKLQKNGINCVYGDASNPEFLDELKLNKVKMIISTIPEKETNLLLLKKIKEKNKNAITIFTGRKISETLEIYNAGADYVILPHFLGGDYTAQLINDAETNKSKYRREKEKQISDLKERINEGQEHPKIEKDS